MARIAKASVAGAKGKEKARAKVPLARRKPVQPESQKGTKEQNPNNGSSLPSVKKPLVSGGLLLFVFLALFIQMILGIFTVLYQANIFLASLHQFGSIILVTTLLILVYKNSKIN